MHLVQDWQFLLCNVRLCLHVADRPLFLQLRPTSDHMMSISRYEGSFSVYRKVDASSSGPTCMALLWVRCSMYHVSYHYQ